MILVSTTATGLLGLAILAGPDPASITGGTSSCLEYRPATVAQHHAELAVSLSADQEAFGVQTSCHFLVIHSSGIPAEQMIAVTDRLERTHELFYRSMQSRGFLLQPLGQPLLCLSFDNRDDFEAYAWVTERQRLPWLEGYYSPQTNRIAFVLEPHAGHVVQAILKEATDVHPYHSADDHAHHPADLNGRISHEAVHQLAFNSGLQKRGVMYPFWAVEGLAACFEEVDSSGPSRPNHVRRGHLLAAWSTRDLRPLDEFLIMATPDCGSHAELSDLYAQAWGVFHFLFTHHCDRLQKYMTRLAKGEPGRRSARSRWQDITATLPPIDELDAGWQRYLQGLSRTHEANPLAGPDERACPRSVRDSLPHE